MKEIVYNLSDQCDLVVNDIYDWLKKNVQSFQIAR